MPRMNNELERARQFLLELPREGERTPVLAAVSGGMDSMCLLYLLATWGAENGFAVIAAHFNHRLRGERADRDEGFVRDWCRVRGIPFVSGSGDTRTRAAREHETAEEAGRALRYAFLEETRLSAGCRWILTAHHADDNAETLLWNLIRGTGSAGLSGIPRIRDGIARPFLEISRAELTDYAAAHAIPHVEDETNQDPGAASRNLLRLQVMPVLRTLNPRAVENMNRAARLLAEENAALDQWAFLLLRSVRFGPESARIPLSALAETPRPVRSRAVLKMCERVGGRRADLTCAHVEAILSLASPDRADGLVSLPYGMRARNTGKALLVELAPAVPEAASAAEGRPVSFGDWTVRVGGEAGEGYAYTLDASALSGPLSVTAWRPDDRIRLPGARGSRSLKRLCVDAGISPWRRDLLPVLRIDGRPAAVPGVGIDQRFAPEAEGKTVLFQYKNQQDAEESGYEK